MKKLFFLLSFVTVSMCLVSCKPPKDIYINDREEYFEKDADKIVMWCGDFEEWQNQLNINERMDFNDIKDDGIQLEQVFVPSTDIDDRLRSARETNSTPDIYMVSIGNLYKEITQGYALELTNYINTWDDLVDTAKEAVSLNDKMYGYPICLEPSSLLFYRKDLLEKYGNTTTIPTKWSDFLTLCETIKQNIKESNTKGLYTFDVPKGVACAWATWGMQKAATGGLAISNDWTTSLLMTTGKEGYTELGNLWASLYGNRYVPLSSGNYTDIILDLCSDKLVMTTSGSWSISTIASLYPEMIDKIGVAVLPTFSGNQNCTTATTGGWVYVISSSCKNVDKALKVLNYFASGDDITNQVNYFEKAYYSKSSPRKSVQDQIIESLNSQTSIPSEWVTTVNSVVKYACLEPIYNWDISVAVELYLEECASGEDVATSLKKADDSIQKIIKDNNLANKNPRQ